MHKYRPTVFVTTIILVSTAFSVFAQRPDTATLIATQREAMKAFAAMDGVWRGPAWTITANGKHSVTQTEQSARSWTAP